MTTMTRQIGAPSRTDTRGGSGLKNRLRARVHRHRLDVELAGGADPNRDPLLRARAGELTSPTARRRIADSLEGVLAQAERAPRPRTAQVPVSRNAIRRSRPELETLVERLRAPAFICPEAVARTSLLLTDGRSPLYEISEDGDGELRTRVSQALDAVDHGQAFLG